MLIWFLISAIFIANCFTYNFDVDFPIIYSDSSRNKCNSYFGYSVIMSSDQTKPWILIGAPKGADPNIQDINIGVVFKCFITKMCKLLKITDKNNAYDGAWIGGSMDINEENNKIIVCGFGWKNFVVYFKNLVMPGICYWSNINEMSFHVLNPLNDPFGDHYSTKIGHANAYFYPYGEAGFSLHFTKNKKQPDVLLGAPGFLNWNGAVLKYNNLTKNNINKPLIPKINYVTQGLFGYSISSGYFFDKNELLYVSSGPKQNRYLGQVIIFSFAKESNVPLDAKDYKQGTQFGEYFGAALASGDINNDGFDDLIVGAPFHRSETYNEGRIYIFYGSSKRSLEINTNLPYIDGKFTEGHFGLTVAFLGDLDHDNYGDFVVGAPYEDEKGGVIYIFRGSESGLIQEPSQIIRGRKIINTIKGFGISFSKSTDIDNNGYKDLAVGAHLSGNVVILRSRPIIELKQDIRVNKINIHKNTDIKICFWYEGYKLPNLISITYTILIDINRHRVFFSESSRITRNITLKINSTLCGNYTVKLSKNILNIIQPVPIKLILNLNQDKIIPSPVYPEKGNNDSFCNTCPVLSRNYKPLDVSVPFALQCGDDDVCTSFLTFEASLTDFSGRKLDRLVRDAIDYFELKVLVVNKGENAYLAQINVEIPTGVFLKYTPKFCEEKNHVIICTMGNPLKNLETKTLKLDLQFRLDLEMTNKNFSGSLKFVVGVSTSSENAGENTNKVILINYITDADVFITGKSKEQSYSYRSNNDSIIFTQLYQIQKVGPSSIDKVIFYIRLPTTYLQKNFLTIFYHKGFFDGQPIFCKNLTRFEYIEEFTLGEEQSELQGNSALIDNTKKSFGVNQMSSGDKSFLINWNDTEKVGFGVVKCVLGPFYKNHVATLKIKAILDLNSISDFINNEEVILLTTFGKIVVNNFVQSGALPDETNITSIFIKTVANKKASWWIILLSAITGLLLLIFLTSGLFKVTFLSVKD